MIQQVTSHELLGVITDEELSWNEHITNICRKVSKNVYVSRKLAMLVRKTITLIIYTFSYHISQY